jgi:xylulokinase
MYLGIDLGTSEVKALLLREDHAVLATARAPLTVQRDRALWSEQSPAAWWQATEDAVASLRGALPQAMASVRAIGLSGQMHGAVLLDARGQVLRPAILWNDGRSAAQCTELELREPRARDITGNLAMPGFTAPKLMWVREHEPAIFDRTELVLLPKDYLRWRMSGHAVSDMSDASGTLWLDVSQRAWSQAMLRASGLTAGQMPTLVEGSTASARLSEDVAARWGVPEGIPIAGGGGDNAASAVGMGCVAPGQGFVSLGTSGVIFVADDAFAPNPARALHTFCHALPGRWHRMSVMLSAASAVTWAARALGLVDESELIALAGTLDDAARADAPLFAPYLGGERTPHNQPTLTAAWHGVTHAHDRAALAHAVVEGVNFGLLDGWRAFGDRSPVTELSAVGGGARSDAWLQALADTLNVSLTRHEGAEAGAALGAARLAWLADGGGESTVCRMPTVARRFEPRATAHDASMVRHRRFTALPRS